MEGTIELHWTLSPVIGRERELARLAGLGTPDGDGCRILYLHGPGGVGKTSLVRAFAQDRVKGGVTVALLEGQHVEPSPDTFLATIGRAIGVESGEAALETLGHEGGPTAIVIDTFERLHPLNGWIREVFLPRLHPRVVVVLAGRETPPGEWRADPRWGTEIRPLPLRNLDAEASRAYLSRRDVPAGQHGSALRFTHGHPLALALVAEVVAQRPNVPFDPGAEPDVVKVLLDRFVRDVRDANQRFALEVCALTRATTEDLLTKVLDVEDAMPLFNWLRGVSFVDAGADGLMMHETAKEAIISELRWRNPLRYAELHRRARSFYQELIADSPSLVQQRALLDYIHLHRDSPAITSFFEWPAAGSATLQQLRTEDVPALVSMTERHEGPDAALLAAWWLRRRPENARVIRNSAGEVTGYLLSVPLHQIGAEEVAADPAIAAADAYLRAHGPLRPGEVGTLFRFWMDAEHHQQVSPGQSLLFVEIVRHYLTTPRLAYTFVPCADPDFWQPMFDYACLDRLVEADFEVGGGRFGVYGHDWRRQPPTAWLEVLAEREMSPDGSYPEPDRIAPILVLSRADFAAAVRDALRSFNRSETLAENPLLRSRVVVDRVATDADTDARMAALRSALTDAATTFLDTPRSTKLHRALHHTYFQPAASQELAAEALGLPFSTYRRHLRDGIDRVTELLWRQELGELTA